MNDYEGLDGLERDYKKLRSLGVSWRVSMKPHWERFRSSGNLWEKFHSFTNLITEGCRASPYYFGHVVVWPLIIVVIVEAAVILTLVNT